ncbi:hypothetical protein [Acetonema longum]|uniref:Uncharacterized protein n=1 Tax=Acetonema longum DSM 6540 TaxID=1009370 RepID=F7NEX5_9FIRM|nr:hypothetical protein [Acetonema longum]EGO65536.1 hypothetical protein ALO_02961 [Acetonema longum DSM 6540]
MLAKLYRSRREERKAIEYMLLAAISPIAFGHIGRRQQCLTWLKAVNPDRVGPVTDPLWAVRQELSFSYHEKVNADFAIYETLIREYGAQGKFREAVSLRILTGELMAVETSAFRQRYGWSPETFFQALQAELEAAGYWGRSELIKHLYKTFI